MGKVGSKFLRRPIKNWNVEHRANDLLQKQQHEVRMAPKHPTSKDAIDQFIQDHPEIKEEVKMKNEGLSHMLKGLVVETPKIGEIVAKQDNKRALPLDRAKHVDPDFGYLEPDIIRPGRCSIRQAVEFLSDHANDPLATGSAEAIAKRYKLDVHRVRNVVHYFHVFNVHLPKRLAGANPENPDDQAQLRHGVVQKRVSLESGKQDDTTSDATPKPTN